MWDEWDVRVPKGFGAAGFSLTPQAQRPKDKTLIKPPVFHGPSPKVRGIFVRMTRVTAPAATKPRIVSPPSTYLANWRLCLAAWVSLPAWNTSFLQVRRMGRI